MMNQDKQYSRGLKKLVEKYRKKFKQPENTDFYSDKYYREAERKFIKHCLIGKPRN